MDVAYRVLVQKNPIAWMVWAIYVLFCLALLNFEKWNLQETPLDTLLGAIETIQVYYRVPLLFLLIFSPYYLLGRLWQKRTWREFWIGFAAVLGFFVLLNLFSPCGQHSFEGKIVVFMCERYRLFSASVTLALALSFVGLLKNRARGPGLLLALVAAYIATRF